MHAPGDIGWLVTEVRSLREQAELERRRAREELVRQAAIQALDYAASTPVSPQWERGASWVLDLAARMAEAGD